MPDSARKRSEPYHVLLELGEGGAAKVYLATTRKDPSEFVVLKVLKAHLANEPELVAMFAAEAKLSQKLHHPNIVRVREVIQSEQTPVIVMEYLEGRSLSEIVQRAEDSLTLEQHLFVIARALDGLHYSHELEGADGKPLGIVHRDMTPHNVFLTYEGEVRLLDFGIAKVNASSVETETGVIKGKVRYMAPEQITGEAIDRRADVFSVGVMLWEAATRTKLWRGVSDTQVMTRVIEGEIPAPSSVRPCPPALERVIQKALALAPADRYANVLALHRELREAVPKLGQVDQAELGAQVQRLFAREIAELERAIQQRLSESSVERAGKLSLPPSRVFANDVEPAPPQANPRLWPLFALAMLLGLASWSFLGARGAGEQAARVNVDTKAPAPTSAASERTVNITAFPAEASLFLDDRPLAENPALVRLKPGVVHNVRAQAPDYVSQERSFVANGPIVLSLQKQPQSAAAGGSDGPTKPRPASVRRTLPPASVVAPPLPSAAAPAPAAPVAPSCEPPYFFDARGVKKYKPQCL